jgi:hypothetical protein
MDRRASPAPGALLLVALLAGSCGDERAPLPSTGPTDGGLDAAVSDTSPAVPDAAVDAIPPDAPTPNVESDAMAPDVAPDTVGPEAAADLAADLAPATDEAPPPDGSAGLGALNVLPSSHDFGHGLVDVEGDPFTFTVLNSGGAPLTGLAVNTNGSDFVTENHCGGTANLASGASCLINVRFKPVTRGPKSGTVIASAGGQTFTASLTGNGQAPARLAISPLQGEFGISGLGPVAKTFTIANIGDTPTGQVSVSLSGPNADDSFKIVANGCLAPLPAAGTCAVTVVLDAPTTGPRLATLTASSPVGGVVAAPLVGLVQ